MRGWRGVQLKHRDNFTFYLTFIKDIRLGHQRPTLTELSLELKQDTEFDNTEAVPSPHHQNVIRHQENNWKRGSDSVKYGSTSFLLPSFRNPRSIRLDSTKDSDSTRLKLGGYQVYDRSSD
jgi:hypothetical protein